MKTGRPLEVSEETFLSAAMNAQYRVIKHWAVDHFIDGATRVAPWTDNKFHLCRFSANNVSVNLTINQIRNRLNKLAEQGVIDRHKKGLARRAHVTYQFPREVCDGLMAKALNDIEGVK